MERDRPIGRKRDSALTMTIGTSDDDSPITTTVQIADSLYIVKERGIYEIKLADQIDPERKNPGIPQHIQQRVLAHGSDSELVGRTLLTARNLFNPNFLPPLFDHIKGLQFAFDALRDVVALHTSASTFQIDEEHAISDIEAQQREAGSVVMPAIGDVMARFHTFIQKGDHTLQSLFNIVKLFYGDEVNKGWFEALARLSEQRYGQEDNFTEFLRSSLPFIKFIRNTRNAIEHPKENQWVEITDFTLNPDGKIVTPSFEVKYNDMYQPPVSVSIAMGKMTDELLTVLEMMIALLCSKHVRSFAGFPIELIQLPEDRRTEKHIRFSYGVHLNGNLVPFA